MNIDNIIKKFNANTIEFTENFHSLIVNICTNTIFTINSDLINEMISIVSPNDTLFQFAIQYDDFDSIQYNDNIDMFVTDQKEQIKMFNPNKSTKICFHLNKNTISSTINIYSIDSFYDYINKSNICEILVNMSSKINNDFLIFNIMDESSDIFDCSNSIIIKSMNSSNTFNHTYIVNKTIKDNFESMCFFLGKIPLNFTPDDFNFSSLNDIKLNKIFSKLKVIFSIIYVFDISDLHKDNLHVKLNGYKNMELKLDIKELNIDNLYIYYDIYKWIYSDVNISDKITISRNIISLYLTTSKSIEIDSSVLGAIKSNYTIYLKENVEKYLDVKSKIIDTILSTNNQISDLINSLTGNFIKNLGAIGTFIVTVTIMNCISDKKLDNIFTTDITIISVFLIIVSHVYLKYTLKDFNYNIDRISTVYNRLKVSYKDILAQKDIDNIFNNDKYFNEDIKAAQEKVDYYEKIWCIILLLFLLAVIILGVILK